MSKFTYGRSIRRRFQWYCQSPGVSWKTDPGIGWELYLTAEGTGPATWYLMGHGIEVNTHERGLKAAMERALVEIDRRTEPETRPQVLRVQPASRIDNLTADGQEMTQQPYPLFVSEDGSVGRQDFWDGRILRVVGFMRDLAVQEVNLWWKDAWTDPQQAVGMYVVARDKDGQLFNLDTAVESITVEGPERPGEDRA